MVRLTENAIKARKSTYHADIQNVDLENMATPLKVLSEDRNMTTPLKTISEDACQEVVVTNTPLQQRKEIMSSYSKSQGYSSAPPCVYGDATFGSVSTAIATKKRLGCNFIGVVKTAYRMFPKKDIEFHLNDLPAGSKLVC